MDYHALQALLSRLPHMSHEEKAATLALLDELESRRRQRLCQDDFLAFIAALDPTYKFGAHLKRLGGLLMQVESGEKDRIAVSVAPRFGKSQMISVYYPAWYLGKHPEHKMIIASNTADLAVLMARKVRNIIQSSEYQVLFPKTRIAKDSKAAGQWATTLGGEVYAVGTGGAIAGRGANLIIVDDPHDEQDIKTGNFSQFDAAYEWFLSGLRTRLMPEGRIALLHTRWHQRDIIGRVVKDAAMNPEADQYEVFEFPAILTATNPLANPEHPDYTPEELPEVERSLWPEQWSLEALQRTRASMPAWQWNAQYMQAPTSKDAVIINKDMIKWWPDPKPPTCEFIVQGWDTALTVKQRSDFSSCQTWGIWTTEDGVTNVILLNRAKGKWDFPNLKRIAHQQVNDWKPDSLIIETKASGQPLVDELRRSGIFVSEFSPGKGQDKLARLNAISDMISSGQVWFPETRWAEEVVEELTAFPNGEHDDDVDCLTLCLMRVRQGGLMPLDSDHTEDAAEDLYARKAAYY